MEKTLEYTLVRVQDFAKEQNMQLICAKPCSLHKDDWYLAIALVRLGDNFHEKYATYLYNSDIEGFNVGHYYQSFSNALKDFDSRK